jgi:cytidylate kinase
MTNQPLQIAIDGPVAAGKGDIAARLSKELNLVYIYTGAMYRALALACVRKGVSFKDTKHVLEVLEHSTFDFGEVDFSTKRTFTILLNGEDVTDDILEQQIAMGASDVSTIPEVRQILVARQKEIAHGKRVVMEGRDIGLRVLPDAQMKIYLTASVEERAHRRFLQWEEQKLNKTFEETLEDTKARDLQDMTRKTDPLMKLHDAWEFDTTGLSQEQVVARIIEEVKKRTLS